METAVLVILTMATALLAMLFVGLLRSHAQILRALHDLGVREDADGKLRLESTLRESDRGSSTLAGPGFEAPGADITGVAPDGSATRVAVTGVSQQTLLAFLSTGCGVCAEFWDELPGELRSQERNADAPRIVVVTQGPESESPGGVRALAAAGATVVMSSDAWAHYAVAGAPYFVMVDGPRSVVIGEGTASSWARVRDLLGRVDEDRITERRSRREFLAGVPRSPRADRQSSGDRGS